MYYLLIIKDVSSSITHKNTASLRNYVIFLLSITFIYELFGKNFMDTYNMKMQFFCIASKVIEGHIFLNIFFICNLNFLKVGINVSTKMQTFHKIKFDHIITLTYVLVDNFYPCLDIAFCATL